MSLILTASEMTLRFALYGIYYTGYYAYSLGRRLIKGKELTPEQKQDLILKQQQQILNSQDTLARSEDQQLQLQALELQLQQQREIINHLQSIKNNKEDDKNKKDINDESGRK